MHLNENWTSKQLDEFAFLRIEKCDRQVTNYCGALPAAGESGTSSGNNKQVDVRLAERRTAPSGRSETNLWDPFVCVIHR